MKKRIWAIVVITFAGWVFILDTLRPGTAELWARRTDQIEKELRQKRKSLKEIKKELSVTKEKEKEIRGKESSVLESLNRLETELYRREKELKQMEAQGITIREKIQNTRAQIGLLNQASEKTKDELSSRLNAFYKMGRVHPETFLFTSQPYPDLLKVNKYLRVVIDLDAHLVNTYRYQVSLKEEYQSDLLRDQSLWQRSISEVAKKKEEVVKIRGTKQALLKSVQNQKAVYQKLIGELEGRGKELQSLVDKLKQEKNQLAYVKPKGEIVKGKLIAPLEGNVLSLFKEKGQNGIEIGAPMGTEVRAVLPGKVLYADWFKGFGNMMIIDHGDHMFTVSAYCSQLLKKVGDAVSQGESIALVGSAGSLKGPCLYFEIRHHGKPHDPMEWIPHADKHKVVSLPEGHPKGRKGL
jgi:septal ring factor EnvC (AmiA/AmiB activator)